jgi:hypothetical protein
MAGTDDERPLNPSGCRFASPQITRELRRDSMRSHQIWVAVKDLPHDPQPLFVTSQFSQQCCKVQLDVRAFRGEPQHCLIAYLSLFEPPQAVEGHCQIVERLPEGGVDLHSLLVAFATLGKRAALREDRPKGFPSIGAIGITLQRKLGGSLGRLRTPGSIKDLGMIAMPQCRRFLKGACSRDELQRNLDIPALKGRHTQLVQNTSFRFIENRRHVVLVHLHLGLRGFAAGSASEATPLRAPAIIQI